jgi:hypothetical protein
METYDQYRIKIIKDKISALKIELLEWEVELEKITGISEAIPNIAMAREMLEKAKKGEIACSDK